MIIYINAFEYVTKLILIWFDSITFHFEMRVELHFFPITDVSNFIGVNEQ